MVKWLLLHYKLPAEPSALRVYVWRKLKRMGAILYQDAVWVLPCTPRTQELFLWLVAEIVEMGGEAALWDAQPILAGKDDNLVGEFQKQVDEDYRIIISQLECSDANLDALSRQYQQIRLKDYFQSELGQQVRQELLSRRGAGS